MNKLIPADRHFNMDSSGTESLVEPLVAVRGTAGGASDLQYRPLWIYNELQHTSVSSCFETRGVFCLL